MWFPGLRINHSSWVVVALALSMPFAASGASLRGSIFLPASFRHASGDLTPGYWRIPNDVLKPLPAFNDPRQEMMLILEGGEETSGGGYAPTSSPVLIMEDAHFNPPFIAIRPGQTVKFVNREPTLQIVEPKEGKFMPAKSISAGQTDQFLFNQEGVFTLHSSETPNMTATVFVTKLPYVSLPNNEGNFQFPQVGAGSYTLRVWFRGKWVHGQPVTVRGKNVVIDVTLPNNLGGE